MTNPTHVIIQRGPVLSPGGQKSVYVFRAQEVDLRVRRLNQINVAKLRGSSRCARAGWGRFGVRSSAGPLTAALRPFVFVPKSGSGQRYWPLLDFRWG